MQTKTTAISPHIAPLLGQLPELDRQAWLPVIEAVEHLPGHERDRFIALLGPLIEMQLSRLASVQQLGAITTEQGERIRELLKIDESLRDELQHHQTELSGLREILVRNGLVKPSSTSR
jgi:hypothetical protein